MDNPGELHAPEGYEAPAVEQVLTPEEVARQVHYAGQETELIPRS